MFIIIITKLNLISMLGQEPKVQEQLLNVNITIETFQGYIFL